MIYLDNNATTQLHPAARDAMLPFLTEKYGNPSSTHRFGQDSRQALESARRQLASLLNCEPRELIFTSGGTESDNAALMGLLAARAPRKVILTSTTEHSAIRQPLEALAKSGHTIRAIPVHTDGTLQLPMLQEVLEKEGPDISLASFNWANNETGVLFDVAEIGALCKQHKVPLHVDAVQAVGKIAINFSNSLIDLMSISGHKFHGPKGTGALVVRRATRWQPFIRGGPQELDRRGGTENVPGIVAMGVAAEHAAAALSDGNTWFRIKSLRDKLERGILSTIPHSHLIGAPIGRLLNTTNIAFANLEAEAILLLLSERDICASAGAACSSGSLEPSPVLRAMNIDDRIAHGAVRFTLSRFTTEPEIDKVLSLLPEVITRLRATLPV